MRRVVFLAALGLAVNGCVASSSGKAAFPVANTHLFSEQELVETKALFQEIAGPEMVDDIHKLMSAWSFNELFTDLESKNPERLEELNKFKAEHWTPEPLQDHLVRALHVRLSASDRAKLAAFFGSDLGKRFIEGIRETQSELGQKKLMVFEKKQANLDIPEDRRQAIEQIVGALRNKEMIEGLLLEPLVNQELWKQPIAPEQFDEVRKKLRTKLQDDGITTVLDLDEELSEPPISSLIAISQSQSLERLQPSWSLIIRRSFTRR